MFKKGDRLKCVNAKDIEHLTEGKIYEALRNSYVKSFHCIERVEFLNDIGEHSELYASRFTLHTPKQTDMIPEGLEPFDLETALKEPDRVVTRDGRSVKIAGSNTAAKSYSSIVGWIKDRAAAWDIDGKYTNGHPNCTDLFLRAKEVVKYVTDYGVGKNTGGSYRTLEDAIREAPNAIAIVALTYRANQLVDVKISHRV